MTSLNVYVIPFLSKINAVLDARLSFNYQGLLEYGVKLFGQKVITSIIIFSLILVWCMFICGFSIINNRLFDIILNPLPILALNRMINNKNIFL